MVRMLSIYLEYYTHGDDRLWLLLKNGEEPMAMQTTDGHDWQCDIETTGKAQDFRFEVRRADGVRVVDRETPGFWHKWQAVDGKRQEKMLCRWHTFDGNAYWYSQAYKDTYCPWHGERTDWNRRTDRVIVVNCPGIPQDEDLIITGNQVELGNWQPEKGVLMRQTDSYTYVVGLETATWKKPTEYKFVLRQRQTGKVVWEDGENRHLDASAGKRCWQEVKPPRMALQSGNVAGVAVPLFALRSEKSWGVGDFGDLKMLIDWASAVGMRAVQLLPVNDTTRTGSWEDSYPYNGISVYALHPMYADLSQLPPLKDSQEHEAMMREREKLQALRQVDYEAVNRLKKTWLTEAYLDYGREERLQSEDYKQFVKENGHWLWPYCYFCVLQEAKGTADFRTWGPLAHYDEMTLARWVRDEHLQERVNYFSWVQFVLDGQMKAVHRYAQAKGVMLKGDMPIGVSRDSATAWFYNDYFHFDGQAGAPPDYFSEKGQNWGFPTYNWERILADGGCWWQLRLQKMAEYFDAFRIDHVLGFFRIWEIPYDASDGRLGHFAPALPMTEEEIHRWGWSKPVSPMTVAAFTTEDLEELLHEKAPQLRRLCFRKGTDGLWHFKKNMQYAARFTDFPEG